MDKHEEFKRIYKKFVDGTRWLNQKVQDGTETEKDKEDFNRLVVEPMEAIWATFTDEEKHHWDMVKCGVELFGGTIVLDEDESKKIKPKRKKQWRRSFRSR